MSLHQARLVVGAYAIAAACALACEAPQHFGAPFAAETPVDLAALVADPAQHTNAELQVSGVVRQNCERMGCWLELATSMDQAAPGCRVTMKGHAFFVPLDSAGSNARVAGRVQLTKISAAQVAHMESEGGHFSGKQADGSANELRIVASGVELARK